MSKNYVIGKTKANAIGSDPTTTGTTLVSTTFLLVILAFGYVKTKLMWIIWG